MSQPRTLSAMIGVVVLLAATIAVADEPFRETFDQSYPLALGGRVSLSNVNGDVSVDVWDQPEVRIQAVKEASSRERLEGLRIEVEARDGSVDIDTRYPSSRTLGWGSNHGHASVQYTLTVPRDSRLETVELVNGHLTVHGVRGGAAIECVNGDIRATELGGSIEMEAVNGTIELEYAGFDSADEVELETVNGAIDLVLGSGAGVDVTAETVNGRLGSELGLEVRKGKYVGATMRGSVGGGGTPVRLETVNGSITVR
jgi:DUF4097 and DUF4098 domain-containing protein YvlB